ncbi:ATP-binding protein [Chryseobacterium sp.]|uniref:ATP-binding protein n=1 Tax=Chryseobacterium sp. TaxID=1871047 RepID=UPI0011CB6899|nr:ATP-binding protein [Chryseobacterium sp.]TXF75116.1 GAF domain-containing protein [Chryseobacterium sp.]
MMNFTACHEEEIHIPGHIQSFGFLLGLDAATKTVKFYSENLRLLFNLQEEIFGKTIEELAGTFPQLIDSGVLAKINENTGEEYDWNIFKISVKWDFFHCIMYRVGENIFIEFEKIIEHLTVRSYIFSKYGKVGTPDSSQKIWNKLLDSVVELVDYERVMVYKFLPDGSGKVVAEKIKDGMESYLHLHYPESDIPRQARELYLMKKNRLFCNVYEEPVRILSKTEKKIDLTYCSVRAMSPIHGQYLKNMGVSSSFSTSIIVENKLWGLISCQNKEPKHIDLVNRVRAEVLTFMTANNYYAFKIEQKHKDSIDLSKRTAELKTEFLKYNNLKDSLFNNIELIKNTVSSDGLAIITGGELKTFGDVPSPETVHKISEWVIANSNENIYSNSSFVKQHKEKLGLEENASGILAAKWYATNNEMLIWFRKEYNEHIKWAGYEQTEPEKVNFYGDERLMISPRKSFEVFLEEIKGKCKLWQDKDLLAAERILTFILETSYTQTIQVKELNETLQNMNNELESFSFTISHDLATPLSVIKMNAQMLSNAYPEDLRIKDKILKITQEIDGMEVMMHNILELSRVKNADLKLERISTEQMIRKISYDAKLSFNSEHAEVTFNNFPDILADKTMIYQVFLNIINNAVKYSSHRENPQIVVTGTDEKDSVVYAISDNGIGISEEDSEKMFKVFRRMDNAKIFQGSGVGLSIVHRAMKRLGGSVTYESRINEGSTFYLTFQKPS